MKVREEVKEVQEVYEVEEKNTGVAAFFDLDGTLVSLPSLEMRFLSLLRYRRFVGIRNYFAWITEAARLLPRGINQILHADKMYLRGISVDETNSLRVPSFFPKAMERVVWHAERGHLLVIVSGTLEPLAQRAARAMEAELALRGLKSAIRVCATRLEAKNGTWTGRIVGEAMFGEAKARAIQRMEDLDLSRCFTYGDSVKDKWMLEIVGKPAAVNPSNDLARIARRNEWTILRWGAEKTFTHRAQSTQRSQRKNESDKALQAVRAKAGFRA